MRNTLLSLGLPKLSAMAAVKYAPPAMPPRKKYQTIRRCQLGVLSTAVPLSPALAERQHGPHADEQRRTHGEQGIDQHVALGQERLLGQLVRRRLVEQQEKGVEPPQRAVLVCAVELRLLVAHLPERGHALAGLGHQLVAEAELDGV